MISSLQNPMYIIEKPMHIGEHRDWRLRFETLAEHNPTTTFGLPEISVP